jgi:hypothetical protein
MTQRKQPDDAEIEKLHAEAVTALKKVSAARKSGRLKEARSASAVISRFTRALEAKVKREGAALARRARKSDGTT